MRVLFESHCTARLLVLWASMVFHHQLRDERMSDHNDRAGVRSLLSSVAQYARYGNLRSVLQTRISGGPRVLIANPMPDRGGHSARRINKLLEGLPQNHRYLEIGLERGETFENVRAPVRWGVDPAPQFDIKRLPRGVTVIANTSDEFFDGLPAGTAFDLVFIDGLHTFQQTYRDVINSCRVCSDGVLLVDDVVPCDTVSAIPDKEEAMREHERLGLERDPNLWHGDVFKVLVCLSRHHPELAFRTIVGLDNPQAVVWRRDAHTSVKMADSPAIDEIDRITYESVFNDGVPTMFHSTNEDDAIAEALAALRAQASG